MHKTSNLKHLQLSYLIEHQPVKQGKVDERSESILSSCHQRTKYTSFSNTTTGALPYFLMTKKKTKNMNRERLDLSTFCEINVKQTI
jgi:hypothetical protein